MNIHKNWLKWLLSSVTLVALTGCATPRYATQTTFVPPPTEVGRSCVARCHTQLNQCQNQCATARQSCINGIEPIAQQAFQAGLRDYEVARRQYESDRQFYELNRSLRMGFGSPVFVPGYGWVMRPGFYGGGFGYPYTDDYAPEPPIAPSLNRVREQLIHERCDSLPCPCEQNFEQCYVGCGGGVQKSVVCIAHCSDKDLKPQPPALPGEGSLQTLTPLPR
ncbi:MAG: hypothetical protein ACYC3A_00285 [Halothiobacillus sp.]